MDTTDEIPGHYTTAGYLTLEDCGILASDDRVELLEGLIISMAPAAPPLDTAVHRVLRALQHRFGIDAAIRVQSAFLAGHRNAPQPDLAFVPGSHEDYALRHPSEAHLIVEVSLTSLPQERLTMPPIYARVGVPCYWIVNLRDRCLEVYRDLDRENAVYRSITRAAGNDIVTLDDFPDVPLRAGDFLPDRYPA